MKQETTIFPVAPVEMERKVSLSRIEDQDLLISTWLRTKGKKTQIAYCQDIVLLLATLGKLLTRITLPDLQDYADRLTAANANKTIKDTVQRKT